MASIQVYEKNLKFKSHIVMLTAGLLAVAVLSLQAGVLGCSISLVCHHLWCGRGDVGREGQALQLCMCCKCSAKSKLHKIATF